MVNNEMQARFTSATQSVERRQRAVPPLRVISETES